ncbi:putative carotene-dioxygenase [Pilobolus umbonatus]|nr:putative carotene-dioxygenase [Pilobolus umbonatus]
MIAEAVALVFLPFTLGFYYLYTLYNKKFTVFSSFQNMKLENTPEYPDPVLLNTTTGRIPSWLHGILYRIGPGRFNIELNNGSTFAIKHAFDGLSFMHRFEINGQTQSVKYNSRMLAKSIEDGIKDKPYSHSIYFGHVPEFSFMQWLYYFLHRLDILVFRPRTISQCGTDGRNVSVTVTPNYPMPSSYDKKERVLMAKTDANVLQKVDSETLIPETIMNYSSYDPKLTDPLSAAHHQKDPFTKETINITVAFAPQPKLTVFSISEEGKVTTLAELTRRFDGSQIEASYIHSFWLTKNYVVIPECPLVYRDKGLNMLITGSFLSSMSWDKNRPTYFHVIQRDQPKLVASIPCPAFFQFHTSNAYESIVHGQTILTLDCCAFENGDIMFMLNAYGLLHGKGEVTKNPKSVHVNGINTPEAGQSSYGDLNRYQLNLAENKLDHVETLTPNLEFPRFNPTAIFKNYRYVFGTYLVPHTEYRPESAGVLKLDIQSRQLIKYVREGFLCSEAIFVPHPDATDEDEGVVLTVANGSDGCYLTVLDGTDLKELSTTKIGPFNQTTFHGSYVDYEFKSISVN